MPGALLGVGEVEQFGEDGPCRFEGARSEPSRQLVVEFGTDAACILNETTTSIGQSHPTYASVGRIIEPLGPARTFQLDHMLRRALLSHAERVGELADCRLFDQQPLEYIPV